MAKSKSKKVKAATKPAPSPSSSTPAPSAAALIDKAHTLLAQSNHALAVQFLERALESEPENREARELVGIAECEAGDVDKGREHLLKLITPNSPSLTPSPYLYLAQTASSPHEALMYYQSAVQILESKIAESKATAKGMGEEEGEGEESRETKDCVTALIAMIEIWMSDLCFDPLAPQTCDALISTALRLSPSDPDALLTLSSIRMSQGLTPLALQAVLKVWSSFSSILVSHAEREAHGEGDDSARQELPEIPTRYNLARLLMEHEKLGEAMQVVESIREEDEEDVEGAYLEGWGWYLKGEKVAAAPAGKEGEGKGEGEEEEMTKEECWTEAMGSLLECRALHLKYDHPDEGILSHIDELMPIFEAAGIKVELADEGDEDEDEEMDGGEGEEGEDVDMA